jgi:hypothetical protein
MRFSRKGKRRAHATSLEHVFGTLEAEAAVLADVRKMVEDVGWAVISILDSEEDQSEDFVGFQFTVGLTERSLPEVIVYGLAGDVGHEVLNELAERLVGGQRYENGQSIPGLVEGDFRLQLWDAEWLRDPLGLAFAIYGERVTVRQLVLPDLHDSLPWEPGYGFGAQPLLFTPPSRAT